MPASPLSAVPLGQFGSEQAISGLSDASTLSGQNPSSRSGRGPWPFLKDMVHEQEGEAAQARDIAGTIARVPISLPVLPANVAGVDIGSTEHAVC